MSYPNSVNFIEFLMDFCIYDDIFDMIQVTDKKLLHFKLSKSGQFLRVDKTCFPRPSHILCVFTPEATTTTYWKRSCISQLNKYYNFPVSFYMALVVNIMNVHDISN